MVAVIALSAGLAACGGSSGAVKWPDVTVQGIDGTDISTASVLDDRPAIVSVWAVWCEPCKKELPQLQAFAAAHPEYNALTVNLGDDPSKVQEFFDSLDLTLPVLLDSDGRFTSSIKVSGVPTTVLVDADRKVVDVHKGVVDESDLADLTTKHFESRTAQSDAKLQRID